MPVVHLGSTARTCVDFSADQHHVVRMSVQNLGCLCECLRGAVLQVCVIMQSFLKRSQLVTTNLMQEACKLGLREVRV